MKAEITAIFPTPIYVVKFRNFTNQEIKFANKIKKDISKNTGNIVSNDNYILNNKSFKKIKEELLVHVNNYFNSIIVPINNIKPYITQSWLNYTDKGQFHHSHEHPNSIISGVLYINADKNNDQIKFYKKHFPEIKINAKEYNLFNSTSWNFKVETGDLILFPSGLTHNVDSKVGDNTRISLAFNTFIKGKIGDKYQLTELII
jgi:uncharacterized protein (TIGR02466 family)